MQTEIYWFQGNSNPYFTVPKFSPDLHFEKYLDPCLGILRTRLCIQHMYDCVYICTTFAHGTVHSSERVYIYSVYHFLGHIYTYGSIYVYSMNHTEIYKEFFH